MSITEGKHVKLMCTTLNGKDHPGDLSPENGSSQPYDPSQDSNHPDDLCLLGSNNQGMLLLSSNDFPIDVYPS